MCRGSGCDTGLAEGPLSLLGNGGRVGATGQGQWADLYGCLAVTAVQSNQAGLCSMLPFINGIYQLPLAH
jgi:hypothetical protein